VQDQPACYPHQLPLGMLDLVVQAAQHAGHRAGLVVLHEGGVDARRFGELAGVEALEEVAAVITEDLRLDDQDFGQGGLEDIHRRLGGSYSSAMRSRYWP